MTHDVGVPVDPTTCTAPGYARTGGLHEDFESGRTTDRWSVEDSLGNGQTWAFGDLGGRGNLTGGTGRFAIVDSDHYGRDGTQDTALVSPSVDLGDAKEPVLEFATDFRRYWSTSAEVDVSVDGGETWSNVWRDFEGQRRSRRRSDCPVPAAAGQDDVRVRFHYLRGERRLVVAGRRRLPGRADLRARRRAGWSSGTRAARSPGSRSSGSR